MTAGLVAVLTGDSCEVACVDCGEVVATMTGRTSSVLAVTAFESTRAHPCKCGNGWRLLWDLASGLTALRGIPRAEWTA